VDSDGGVEAIYEGELAHGHASSLSHVEAPPYLECCIAFDEVVCNMVLVAMIVIFLPSVSHARV